MTQHSEHKKPLRLAGLILAAVLLAPSAMAQEDVTGGGQRAATRIEVDEQAHVVRIFIDGQPAALINKAGLRVVNDVEYGGAIVDVGPDAVRDQFENNTPASQDGDHATP